MTTEPASPPRLSAAQVGEIREIAERLQANVERVIVGKTEVVRLAMVALLCEGHILLEDVPGIGKTTLAKAIARSLGCSFRRIQFTPDLMPSDMTGINYYNQKLGEFVFREGPLIAQVVLADEINRATPRTQAALLEAMEERQITVEGVTTRLPRPFLVLATQNPVELEGTFPLPEAQLDRFLVRLKLGYPDEDGEDEILVPLRDNVAARLAPAGRRRSRVGRLARRSRISTSTPESGATPCGLSAKPATTRRSNLVRVRAAAWACSAPRAPMLPWKDATTSFPTTSRRWRRTSCLIASSCRRRRGCAGAKSMNWWPTSSNESPCRSRPEMPFRDAWLLVGAFLVFVGFSASQPIVAGSGSSSWSLAGSAVTGASTSSTA